MNPVYKNIMTLAMGLLVLLAIFTFWSGEPRETNEPLTYTEFLVALDEGQKLAMAQSYDARAYRVDEVMRQAAESPYLGIHERARNEGIGGLTSEEQARVRLRAVSDQIRFDNFYYQHEQGFLDDVYYESIFTPAVRTFAPQWKALGLEFSRPGFREEVDRILSESEAESESEENGQ